MLAKDLSDVDEDTYKSEYKAGKYEEHHVKDGILDMYSSDNESKSVFDKMDEEDGLFAEDDSDADELEEIEDDEELSDVDSEEESVEDDNEDNDVSFEDDDGEEDFFEDTLFDETDDDDDRKDEE